MSKTEEELEREKAKLEAEAEAAARAAGNEAAAKGASPEEVNAAIEKARKEEKDKLYPQLDEVKSALKEMQDAFRAEREEKEQIKKAAEEKAEQERLAGLSATEKQLEAIKRIEEQLTLERQERQRLENAMQERERKNELEKYREALVSATKDEIIPDLVRGDTKEEIDASFAIAKARYKELEDKLKTELGAQVKKNLSSASPGTEALDEEDLEEQQLEFDPVKFRNDKDYADRIKAQLARAYARQSGQ